MKAAWPPRELAIVKADLEQLADAVRSRPPQRTDDEQTWLTKLLIVRMLGYLEQVLSAVVRQHISEKSGGTVRSFATSWVTRSRNASTSNLLDIVGRFDASMRDELETLLESNDQHLLRSLNNVAQTRHDIAHGKSGSLSPARALSALIDVETVADWLTTTFDPRPKARSRA